MSDSRTQAFSHCAAQSLVTLHHHARAVVSSVESWLWAAGLTSQGLRCLWPHQGHLWTLTPDRPSGAKPGVQEEGETCIPGQPEPSGCWPGPAASQPH